MVVNIFKEEKLNFGILGEFLYQKNILNNALMKTQPVKLFII
jgi:hypothetical protein